jgi:uroporphyrinogen III methyltransferase/synthase
MSVARLDRVVAHLLAAGRAPDEPVAVIERGTLPDQRTLTGTLGDIVDKARAAGVQPPALTIVGRVVAERDRIAWFEESRTRGRRILLLSTKDEAPVEIAGVELTRVSPLAIVPRFAELKSALSKLHELRAIAFASAHAVEHFVGALMSTGRDLRALAGIKLACVGAATAHKLERMHLRADLTGHEGGEALAREMIAAGWQGPMLLPRAADGRDELADALRAAGVRVEVVAAYETIADDAALAAAARAHRSRRFDAIAFASPKGARAFLDVLGRNPETLIGAIGETTRAALAEAGVRVDFVPPSPDLDALVAGLADRIKIE